MQMRRPAGQLYMPEAVAKVIARYSFIKHPTVQDLTERRDFVSFGVGKFADSQIQEFRVYGDGFTVEARSKTQILDAFLDDLLDWGTKEFGLEAVPVLPVERHYESAVVVQSKTDLSKVLRPLHVIAEELNKLMEKSTFKPRPFEPTGLIFSVDQTAEGSRRKEPKVIVDRRVGTSFNENIFYSQGPLPTDDHLALLGRLEALAG